MGYTVLSDRDSKWQPRKGLEGPFFYSNGRVLYYDVKAGKYYNPLTDFYVDQEEMNLLHAQMLSLMSRAG